MNKQEISEIVETLIEAYGDQFHRVDPPMPGEKPEEVRLRRMKALAKKITFWFKRFGSEDFLTVSRAIDHHIDTNKYSPKVSEIREKLVKIVNPELTLTAGQEWELVYSRLGTYGRNGHDKGTKGLSEVTQQVVRSMGWSYLCNSTEGKWDRERFIKMYDELKGATGEKVAQGQTVREAIGVNASVPLLVESLESLKGKTKILSPK